MSPEVFFTNYDAADPWGSLAFGRSRPHRGADFPWASGTEIPAYRDGRCVIAQWSPFLGLTVVLSYSDGLFGGFCHLQDFAVQLGQVVAYGDTIGRVGETGSEANGPHLHTTLAPGPWNVFNAGTPTLDPYPYIWASIKANTASAETAGQLDASIDDMKLYTDGTRIMLADSLACTNVAPLASKAGLSPNPEGVAEMSTVLQRVLGQPELLSARELDVFAAAVNARAVSLRFPYIGP